MNIFLGLDINFFIQCLKFALIFITLFAWLFSQNSKEKIQDGGKAFSTGMSGVDTDQQFGDIVALERFNSVRGLPGYPPLTRWQRFFGAPTPMELLFTQSSLIFCDPSASAPLTRTSIPYINLISARTDYNNGAILIIKSKYGTIRCDTQRTFGAKPAKNILEELLVSHKTNI